MTADSNRNLSPATGMDSSLQARKRVRYVLPKGCIIGGSYCIEKPLGHGGMGEVYLARHMKLDIYRAIKILLPKIAVKNPVFATRFMREAKLAIQLQHPNIINVMDAEYDERLSIYYIVMEYVDGGTVRNLIRKNGPMNEREVLKIVLRVGEALAAGEERKIVHRDIKPDNIMLTKDNLVKLADLGIAKSSADSHDVDVTSPEILIGTPAYVSPEQAKDAQHVDSRADIYSLGVSMYEMLTAEKPYKGKTTVEILQQLFADSVPEVRQKNQSVSRKVSDLVYRMMAKEKEKRPRNWKVFCKEVSLLLDDDEFVYGNETATTSVENIKDILPKSKGIVLGSDENKPLIDKKKVKKIARYSVFVLLGFAICFLLFSGVLSPKNLAAFRNSIALGLIGKEYREQCKTYHLTPPLYLVLSSGSMKQIWIDQNKPAPPPPPPRPSPEDGKVVVIGKQTGKIKFVINADDALKQWWKINKHKMKVRASQLTEKSLDLPVPDELELECGTYDNLKFEIPGIRKYISSDSIKIENRQEAASFVIRVSEPLEATLNIVCDVSDIAVTVNGKDSGKKIKVLPFRDQEICITAKGYKSKTQIIKGNELFPGETKTVKFVLEKRSATPRPVSKEMIDADKNFKDKKYAAALNIYRKIDHPHALYRQGIIYRDRLAGAFFNGDWKECFSRAAEGEHLGGMYEYGKIKQDEGKYRNALIWYRKCEEQNFLPALVKLGDFYRDGKKEYDEKTKNIETVVARDEDTALKYYKRTVQIYERQKQNDAEAKIAYQVALRSIIAIYDQKPDSEKSRYIKEKELYKDKLRKLKM